jgi:hypothetical protein
MKNIKSCISLDTNKISTCCVLLRLFVPWYTTSVLVILVMRPFTDDIPLCWCKARGWGKVESVLFATGKSDFSRRVQKCFDWHFASYLMGSGSCLHGTNRPRVMLTTHINLVLRLRTSEAIPLKIHLCSWLVHGSFIFYLLYDCVGLISNIRFVVMLLCRLGRRMLIWIRGKAVRPCGCLNSSVKGLCVGGGVFPRILILGTIHVFFLMFFWPCIIV